MIVMVDGDDDHRLLIPPLSYNTLLSRAIILTASHRTLTQSCGHVPVKEQWYKFCRIKPGWTRFACRLARLKLTAD
jgi:hypothetical protein